MNKKRLLVLASTALLLILAGCSGAQPFQQLTDSLDIEGYSDWSPDGKRIVYGKASDYSDPSSWEIWIMNSDGSSQTKLGQGEFPRFSPDSRKLVYSNVTFQSSTLQVMNVNGTEVMTIINDPKHSLRWPTWSPDGKQISFVRDKNELWIADADGNNQIQITQDNEFLGQTKFIGINTWNPDGKQIAFERADQSQVWNIWIINADGTNLRQLTFDVESNWSPDWSLNGKKIAFEANIRSGSIDIINPDGSERETLLSAGENSDWKAVSVPSWSPDGREITFDAVYKGDQLLVDIWVFTLSD